MTTGVDSHSPNSLMLHAYSDHEYNAETYGYDLLAIIIILLPAMYNYPCTYC